MATAALALPALATTHNDAPSAGANPTTPTLETSVVPSTTSTLPATTTTTTVAAPTTTAPPAPVPTPQEQFAASFSAMTPEQQLAFKLYVASPAERSAFAAYVSPHPAPKPKPAPAPAPKPKATAPTTTPAAEQAPATATAPTPAPAAAPAPSTGPANSFLACVRNRESGGNYQIGNGQGYWGAYQFSQSTWNNTAAHAGRGDLVGVNPAHAAPGDQDAMAAALYAWQGRSPWAGPGC